MEVALAAVKLAHEASGAVADDEDIPDVAVPRESDRPQRSKDSRPRDAARPARRGGPNKTRLFIGLGRAAGVRPQDLVGAIANESRVSGRDIGAIEITDAFSLVEVPSSKADEVIDAEIGNRLKTVLDEPHVNEVGT